MVVGITFAYDNEGVLYDSPTVLADDETTSDLRKPPSEKKTLLHKKLSRLEDCGCGSDLAADVLAEAVYFAKHTYQCDQLDMHNDALYWREQFGGETGRSLPKLAEVCGRLPYLAYRSGMALFATIILLWTVRDAAVLGQLRFWPIYFGHWVTLLMCAYFWLALLITAFAIVTAGRPSRQKGPKLVWLCWTLYGALLPSAYVHALHYWLVLYDGAAFPLSLGTTLGVPVLTLVDLLVGGRHYYYYGFHGACGLAFNVLYLLFTVVYCLTDGVDPYGNNFIYQALDWGSGRFSVGKLTSVMLFLLTPLLNGLFWFFFWGERRTLRALREQSEESKPRPAERSESGGGVASSYAMRGRGPRPARPAYRDPNYYGSLGSAAAPLIVPPPPLPTRLHRAARAPAACSSAALAPSTSERAARVAEAAALPSEAPMEAPPLSSAAPAPPPVQDASSLARGESGGADEAASSAYYSETDRAPKDNAPPSLVHRLQPSQGEQPTQHPAESSAVLPWGQAEVRETSGYYSYSESDAEA